MENWVILDNSYAWEIYILMSQFEDTEKRKISCFS